MFCSKCGKEIHDEAVVCIHCGCAVGGGSIQQAQQHSLDYLKFKDFQKDVKNIHTLGILSLVLCFGIGIFFSIPNISKINKYYNKQDRKYILPVFNLKDSHEIAEYENSVRKFNSGKMMTSIGLGLSVAAIWILIVLLLASLA